MTKIPIILSLVFSAQLLFSQVYLDIDVDQAKDTIEANLENPVFTILDVRTPGEYLPEHIEGAFHRDFYDDDFSLQMDSLDKTRTYLIYCASGGRSGAILELAEELNFERVYNLLGGMGAWKAAGYPVTDEIPAFVDIFGTTSSYDEALKEDINIYPNPVSDFMNVGIDIEIDNIQIMNVDGKVIRSLNSNINQRIDLSGLSEGSYYLKVEVEDRWVVWSFIKI